MTTWQYSRDVARALKVDAERQADEEKAIRVSMMTEIPCFCIGMFSVQSIAARVILHCNA